MKGFLSLAAGLSVASAAAINNDYKISDLEILDTLLHNSWLLPRSMGQSLRHKAQTIQKRHGPSQAPQPVAPPPTSASPVTPAAPVAPGFPPAIPKDALQGKGGKGNLPGLLGMINQTPPANAPKSTVPEIVRSKGVGWADAERVKVRYGPYRIPPTSEANFHSQNSNVQGMSDTLKIGARKPCDDDCTVLALVADLEYADGSAANNSNGAWFHHAVLLNSGGNVIEPNCGMGNVENIFMSGNERTTGGFALPGASIKSGYSLSKANTFILTTELMNLHDQEKFVWMTITYEILPGKHPDFKQGKTIWLSLGGLGAPRCGKVDNPWGPSNLTISQQPKSKVFSEHSLPWTAPKDGYVLSTGGHMHDGGVNLKVFHGDNVICTSTPKYVMNSHSHGMGGMKKRQVRAGNYTNTEIPHIETQDTCLYRDGLPLKKGDKMFIQANYDFNLHPGMKNVKGELDEVMGISGTLVAF